MGRNGSGKTTLSYTIMGHPKYVVTAGQILLDGVDIAGLSREERARKRIFLGFQYPWRYPASAWAVSCAPPCVPCGAELPAKELRAAIRGSQALNVPDAFLSRSLNEGFSGGEKKSMETWQTRVWQPGFAVPDETESGLDIDALRTSSERVECMKSPDRAILLITHYQRMLSYVKPDKVHVFVDGRIIESGGPELALKLEEKGYEEFVTAGHGR